MAEGQAQFVFAWGVARVEVVGSEELVREGFALVREEVLPRRDAAAQQATDLELEPATAAGSSETAASGGEGASESVEDFYKQKGPKTAQERVVVFAAFARRRRALSEFGVADLQALYNEAHVPMDQVQNAIYNAARKSVGWLRRVEGRRNTYQVTPAGENYVDTKLPSKK